MNNHTPTTLRDLLDEIVAPEHPWFDPDKAIDQTAQSILEQLKALLPEKKYTSVLLSSMEGSPLLLEHIGFNEAIELVEKAIEEWAK